MAYFKYSILLMSDAFFSEASCYMKVSTKEYDSGIDYIKLSFYYIPKDWDKKKIDNSSKKVIQSLRKEALAIKNIPTKDCLDYPKYHPLHESASYFFLE